MSTRSNRSFTETTLTMTDGTAAGVRLYDGAEPVRSGAHVLHFHGGCFVSGSLESGATVAQVLSEHAAVVASFDYPLAPVHPFPRAVEAGYQALQWLDKKRRQKGRLAPLFVAGEDAGGNIAAAVAMMARDRGGPQLAGQILLSPMLDNALVTASQRDVDGPLGCPCADGWRAYLACVSDAMHPYATPGASLRLAGLPPTLLLSASDDPLRDEAMAYAQRLEQAGVEVLARVLQMPTGWPKTYADGADAPWIEPLRQRVQPFLSPLRHTQLSTVQP